jgi:sugar lactone lactonase YvrE
MNIECVAPIAARLGEGPLWSARERAVWFVDIKGRGIHRYDEATRTTRSWQTPQDVGFIVAASGGRFICGFKSGLHLFAPETGSFQLLTPVDGDRRAIASTTDTSTRRDGCGSAPWTMQKSAPRARCIASTPPGCTAPTTAM